MNLIMFLMRKVLFSLFLLPSLLLAEEQKISEYDLSQKMMSFSDNYQESISETIDTIIAQGIEPESRLLYQTIKVFYTHSVISIATESDSIHQLLDMLVMVRLQRLVWMNGGHPNLSTEKQAAIMSKRLQKLEVQLHKTANDIFSNADIQLIMSLTEKWKNDNPTRDYVAFVRFQDFGHSEDKAQIDKKLAKGGLFSTISETSREIEETRHAIDRGMFLINRMPILLEWQAELFLYRIFATVDVQQVLEIEKSIQASVDKLTTTVEKMPREIQSVIENGAGPINGITDDIVKASENLRLVSDQLTPLFTEFNNSDSEVDVEQVESIFKDALATSQQLVKVTENLNEMSYNPDAANHLSGLVTVKLDHADTIMKKRLDDLDNKLIAHRELIINSLFTIVFLVCLVFPVVFFSIFLLVKRHLIRYENIMKKDESTC